MATLIKVQENKDYYISGVPSNIAYFMYFQLIRFIVHKNDLFTQTNNFMVIIAK